MLVLRAEAGTRPGGRGTCSLLRQRKVPKRKATPSLRPLRCATGQTCVGAVAGCAVELALRWRAPLGQPRRVSSRGMGAATPMLTPQPPRRRRSQQGVGHPNIQQPNSHTGLCFARPHLAGASATRCANWAERSNGPNGCPLPGFPSGCAEERSGQRIRARDCLSAVKRSEFERDPAGREHRRLPEAQRRDADSGVAFFCLLFLATQEKKVRRRAHIPAPALGTSKPPDQRASPARTGERCRTQSLSIQ